MVQPDLREARKCLYLEVFSAEIGLLLCSWLAGLDDCWVAAWVAAVSKGRRPLRDGGLSSSSRDDKSSRSSSANSTFASATFNTRALVDVQ